jgi:DNA-binding response OmpR family regulator
MAISGKPHILVVDDEPRVRESLGGFLSDAGYDVSTAEHGFDALFAAQKRDPGRHHLRSQHAADVGIRVPLCSAP